MAGARAAAVLRRCPQPYSALLRSSCAGCRLSSSAGGGYYPPPDLSRLGTADLADLFVGNLYELNDARASSASSSRPRVQALEPLPRFWDFGGHTDFAGRIATVQCFENNLQIRALLSEPGNGRVLVADTAASPRAALVGDNLAELAVASGWAGILLNGFLRDAACLRSLPIGIKALGTYPVKSGKRDWGVCGVPLHFGGVTFRPGDYLYADEDGILVADADLRALAAEAASESAGQGK